MKIAPFAAPEEVKDIATHPKVWPWISDAFTFEFEVDPRMLYLSIDGKGFIAVEQLNHICYQVHIALLPDLWGLGMKIGAAVKEWIFSNTVCKKIIAMVPADNRPALRLAKKLGMREEGRITKSFQRGIVLIDQVIFGIEREA
jgi:RimJ/RimL family protein N-acetyltransferase